MLFSRWVIRRLVPEGASLRAGETRVRVGLWAGWTSVGVNLVIFALKGALAWLTGSLALLADTVHTLSDLLTSLIVVMGFHIAGKRPDPRHPYGHGRMEAISALVLGVVLAAVAVQLLVNGVRRLLNPQPVHVETLFLLLLAGTMVIKEFLARLSIDLGKASDSQALRVDAAHHRSDVLTTGLVIVAFIGARYELFWLDGVMTIGVAGLIGWTAGKTLVEVISPLLGERPPDSMLRSIEKTALGLPQITGVHEIMVHRYGRSLVINLHVEVRSGDALMLHEIGQALETRLASQFTAHVLVHIDPVNPDHPHYAAVRRIVEKALSEEEWVSTYHDLRLLGSRPFTVEFDVAPRDAVTEAIVNELRDKVAARLREQFPESAAMVRLDAPYFEPPQG